MVLLEAGLLELDEQVTGRSRVPKTGLEWANITREVVLARAWRLQHDLTTRALQESNSGKPPTTPPIEVLRNMKIGDSQFRDRWRGKGGMEKYLVCMVRYTCVSARWHKILDRGPKLAAEALPAVSRGERSLADLVSEITAHDLKLWTRLARCWLFPLLLTMDTLLKPIGHQAFNDLLGVYSANWTPVFDQGLATLGVRFRPGVTPTSLSRMLSAHISGVALGAAGNGQNSDRDFADLAHAVQALLLSAVDPGDGASIGRALDSVVHLDSRPHENPDR
ncbi:hypothetical protein AB0A63_10470 [Lentzea sp. NPDC042327]|uniref:hypothetical protein n=1 Tax=Lentzea sp. NPDC042327 TaxID=3154801 RepID=UPI0033D2E885